jgi:hypothetical protein
LGQAQTGLDTLERAVARADSDDGSVRMHAAHAHLLLGSFARGWELNESRFLGAKPAVAMRQIAPRWRGDETLRGKKIAILAEQGLGDAIHFCRYVPLLTALGADVILEAPAAIRELMQSIDPYVTVVAAGSAARADYQCPLMSLAQSFGTQVSTIPSTVPYLKTPPERSRAWRQRLGTSTRLRVGLACTGNSRHNADRRRSLPYANLGEVMALDCEFHLLQNDLRAQDVPHIERAAVFDHRQEIADLADTAALIDCMDLVICVDTAIAHLTGALGKPLWLLLAKPSDWRWLLHRADSPWYPTARLFRMRERGNWRTVVDAVRAELAGLIDQHGTPTSIGTCSAPPLPAQVSRVAALEAARR